MALFLSVVNMPMKLHEIQSVRFIANPFPRSKVKRVLYHGTNIKFDRFERAVHGIYVTPSRSWAETHYGNVIIPLWANVTKMYEPTEDEIDLFYNVEYQQIAKLLDRLSQQGYNACMFGGESESIVLFNNIEIVHAETGRPL